MSGGISEIPKKPADTKASALEPPKDKKKNLEETRENLIKRVDNIRNNYQFAQDLCIVPINSLAMLIFADRISTNAIHDDVMENQFFTNILITFLFLRFFVNKWLDNTHARAKIKISAFDKSPSK